MNKKNAANNSNEAIRRIPLDFSNFKNADKFSMQVGTKPYRQLGIGARCKVKGCVQPVYSELSGLCSYHRMEKASVEFEDMLRARQQQAIIERNKD